jgi:tetratricopeptide repeat protein
VNPNNAVYDSRDNCNAIIETSSNKLILGSRNTIIPNTVTTIGKEAFYTINIANITIPDSVTAIGDNAFLGNNLTSITIPNTVTYVGSSSFAYNNLSYVLIEENSVLSTLKGSAFSSSNSTMTADGIIYVNNPNLKKIYYNGTTPLPWIYAVSSNYAERNNKFVTGTVPTYTRNSITYNEVVITAGK